MRRRARVSGVKEREARVRSFFLDQHEEINPKISSFLRRTISGTNWSSRTDDEAGWDGAGIREAGKRGGLFKATTVNAVTPTRHSERRKRKP